MAYLALDLFCGAGGVSRGLHDAGFEVIGIDNRPQPHFPIKGNFVQADALNVPFDLSGFDFIWASPPCQAFTWASGLAKKNGKEYKNLIQPVRQQLINSGALWCIENVPGSPLRQDIVLDGTMFPQLRVLRKRIFETSFFCLQPSSRRRRSLVQDEFFTICGKGIPSHVPPARREEYSADNLRAAMGIDWMPWRQLSQAIPPCYAEFIGQWALRYLDK